MEIEKMLQEYKTIKDELNDTYRNKPDSEFLKLVSVKGIDEELKETLILLHGNYNTELTSYRENAYRLLYRIIDENELILKSMHKELNEAEKRLEESAAKHKKGKWNIWSLWGVVLIVPFLTLFAHFFPSGFDKTIGSLEVVGRFIGVLDPNYNQYRQAEEAKEQQLEALPAPEHVE